uniref:Orf269a n=1 Tax=Peronospora tabacina TaxID=230439 RepID=A0A0P0HEM5_9STRA|nr:orf269a [Peronospora tabacina]ALJ78426.1 orf269a [Peronospora tabacina]ALJ78473.1 orf269a [Peronospora tabacina]
MNNQITQTQTITLSNIEETRMVLRPQTLFLREQFQNQLENQLNNSTTNRLPYLNRIETIQSLDSDTIIELNNTTNSERRVELMESIINHQNSSENHLLLIENSSPQVRTYLHDLLIRSANNFNITEEDLYRVGNIFLYTISNLDVNGLVFRDIIQNMRESMVIYNTNQVFSVLDTQMISYNDYLDGVRLATETQLEERAQEFHQEVNQRIALNRRRVLYTGIGLLGSMALSSFGFPPIGGLLIRGLTSSETVVSSTQSSFDCEMCGMHH